MQRQKGFSLVELIIALALLSTIAAIVYNVVNPNLWQVTGLSARIRSDFMQMEMGVTNYYSAAGSYPASLSDNTFVPQYLTPPSVASTFDATYGTGGYLLAQQTGQASPNNGYYLACRVTVTGTQDPNYKAIKQVAANLSVQKFFYNTSVPAVSNMGDPAGNATVYLTYWLTRN
ncbi:MAG: prepilin-type N-terminal cleavage/methylation domain-containing protein [Nitrospirae bacterium]|nr:prepilin-type N-terminal cleavage/methylation domain-containing protein [Nitrospirota bacterium]